MEWYNKGQPKDASYRYNDGRECPIYQNVNSFKFSELLEEIECEYVCQQPKYQDLTPDEATICLLNKETLEFRVKGGRLWISFSILHDGRLTFETYDSIKDAEWRKKIQ